MSKQSDKPNEGVKNLAEIRKIAGITQKELARLSGVAHITIRAVETGRQQYSDQLVEKLARGLGCGVRFSRGEQPPELTKTRLQSVEEYTREWFEHWKLVCERKRVYSRFLMQYSDILSDMAVAACELDLEEEQKDAEPDSRFIQADKLAEKLLGVFIEMSRESDMGEKLLAISNREFAERCFTDASDMLSHRLDELKGAIDTSKRSYLKGSDKG
ncbi:helix-turn-helix transcriptional regulator [Coraliomargarita algicola]|uniref:Helix-turn-helix transcriptional regulator n=1 Tax=Coraliomargarita algicola TaxID=3092156 RepID=A0ABZ0RI92_9BACT|nr:helix-turn-helix transcriptional regulator [Coraliomargarita sp. J2-16]WPJ95925.1 helix-turn-helix transcriptional regulator [Coraliomargarita sp. J2-16]